MKKLLNPLGILGIVLAIVFALYGSVKMTKANADDDIIIDNGIIYQKQMSAAKKALSTAGILFVGGIFLIYVGRKSK